MFGALPHSSGGTLEGEQTIGQPDLGLASSAIKTLVVDAAWISLEAVCSSVSSSSSIVRLLDLCQLALFWHLSLWQLKHL